ncbi:MAG: hypothetical protein ACFB13_02235 [Kiloniellaceae bacterium]
MARKTTKTQQNGNGANLGFEARLWAAADKLRGNMEASYHKHVHLGIMDASDAKWAECLDDGPTDGRVIHRVGTA